MFLIQELKLGGDLKFLLSWSKRLSEDAVRYLTAELSPRRRVSPRQQHHSQESEACKQ
ncbi:hypothetical protein CcCBS67573_g09521 [Chytriomyces confervae]|uniref:Uncharacterized protein n=1 Tax=Chytriomyces confervae TaxID=246404 RepID=A0A507DU20_9FUNG|nr:hypothetical protein CcCBS67573_g09521 [Chytriomyces confervae]